MEILHSLLTKIPAEISKRTNWLDIQHRLGDQSTKVSRAYQLRPVGTVVLPSKVPFVEAPANVQHTPTTLKSVSNRFKGSRYHNTL